MCGTGMVAMYEPINEGHSEIELFANLIQEFTEAEISIQKVQYCY